MMTIASQVRWSGKKGTVTLYRNRNSYNCSQQSRDEHRTFKTSKNFQQRWTLDFRKTEKLSVEMPMGLQKNNLKLSAEMDIMGN